MPRISFSDIQRNLGDAEVYDIVNAIRNEDPNFAQYVPLANAENVADIGNAIMVNQRTQNDFITNLVDRISLTIIRSITLENPLARFKKGRIELGKVIQEIFVDLTEEKLFDAKDAENTVFKREIPNTKTLYHERNRQSFYEQSITEAQLATAFTSWNTFGSFIAGIINAIYNSAEVDEYKYMKLLIDNAYSKGDMTVVPINDPSTGTASAQEFIKKARATYTKLTLPQGSRDFNSLAVHTRSYENSVHIFIDADLMASVDVDVLASAFNMSKTDFLGNKTIIDGLASEGLEAVMVDEDWFQVYDNELAMRSIYNPKNLTWNYFYHVWQTFSISRFSNAVAFVSGDVHPITQAIVTPSLSSIKAGNSMEFESFIRKTDKAYKEGAEASTDNKTYTVSWSVAGMNNTQLQTGTSMDGNTLNIAENQTGDLVVTQTVTFQTGVEADETTPILETVTGEALVNVVPA